MDECGISRGHRSWNEPILWVSEESKRRKLLHAIMRLALWQSGGSTCYSEGTQFQNVCREKTQAGAGILGRRMLFLLSSAIYNRNRLGKFPSSEASYFSSPCGDLPNAIS